MIYEKLLFVRFLHLYKSKFLKLGIGLKALSVMSQLLATFKISSLGNAVIATTPASVILVHPVNQSQPK